MKILVYGINFAPELTGVGKYTAEMAGWLVARGHEVRVVTACSYYPQWRVDGKNGYQRETIDGAELWRCPLYVPSKPNGIKRIFHLISFALSSFPIILRHTTWRADLVWVVEPAIVCLPGALIVAYLSGSKTWLHVQDFEVDAAFELGLVKSSMLRNLLLAGERLMMNCFDKVSTISARMVSLLHAKGIHREKITFFPNWVDTTIIRPLSNEEHLRSTSVRECYRKEWGIQDSAVIVLYSGNMGYKQGLEIVVEVARRLSKHQDIFFVLCGNGVAYSYLRKLAEGLDNVQWIPLQPFCLLNDLLNTADIHLLPQKACTADLVMPSKLTGIFASGRPVIAIAEPRTEIFDVVARSGGGFTVMPGDIKGLASSIMGLAQNPAQRIQLGGAAREYAIKNLDRNLILADFEKLVLGL